MNSNGRAPTTVETWPGPMKPSRRRSGDSSSARSGGTIVTWLHTQEKLDTPSAFARFRVSAVDGAVVSNPIAKKITSRSGVLLRDPQRVERRVDHAHVGALGLRVHERALRAGHAHHVAEAGEDHARLLGDRDAVVHAPHRDHADRAAGAVHQLDVRRAAGRRCRTCRSSACGRRRPPSPCSGGRARPWRGSRPPPRGPGRRRGTRRRTSRGDLQPRDRGPRMHEQLGRRATRPPGRSRPWRARRPRLRRGRATGSRPPSAPASPLPRRRR